MINDQEQGVDFDFATGAITQLAPNQRVVVVENLDAFQLRYGTAPAVAGQWSGRLSNGSETITLSALGTVVQQFTYADSWQQTTDGEGATLELINPANPDLNSWNQPVAWRASATRGGTPGRDTAAEIPGDANRDGVFNSGDLVAVFQVGKYEDAIPGNATWAEGDWDGDGDFTSADIVLAFQYGAYAAEAAPAANEPLSTSTIAAALDSGVGEWELLSADQGQLATIADIGDMARPRRAVDAPVAVDRVFDEWREQLAWDDTDDSTDPTKDLS